MDQDLAKRIFFTGAFLFLLDAPKLEITLDLCAWTMDGKHFLGFKMISPGFHFLSYKLAGSASSIGIPLFLHHRQVVAFKWCKQTESFIPFDHGFNEESKMFCNERFDGC